jgi:hypothetical protein
MRGICLRKLLVMPREKHAGVRLNWGKNEDGLNNCFDGSRPGFGGL